jgi:hypothetical protein
VVPYEYYQKTSSSHFSDELCKVWNHFLGHSQVRSKLMVCAVECAKVVLNIDYYESGTLWINHFIQNSHKLFRVSADMRVYYSRIQMERMLGPFQKKRPMPWNDGSDRTV